MRLKTFGHSSFLQFVLRRPVYQDHVGIYTYKEPVSVTSKMTGQMTKHQAKGLREWELWAQTRKDQFGCHGMAGGAVEAEEAPWAGL